MGKLAHTKRLQVAGNNRSSHNQQRNEEEPGNDPDDDDDATRHSFAEELAEHDRVSDGHVTIHAHR